MRKAAWYFLVATCALGCGHTIRIARYPELPSLPQPERETLPPTASDQLNTSRPAIQKKQTPATSPPLTSEAELVAAKPATKISIVKPRPATTAARTEAVRNAAPAPADAANQLWYGVGTLCGAVFTSILAPLFVEWIKHRAGASVGMAQLRGPGV
jgi:hypothetical protein